VWSNDVYKSVEHRAVCNSIAPRLSMAFFLNPIDKATIAPAATRDLPPLYRPFTWEEYRQHMYKHRPRGKSNLACFRRI
jgi:isopenicillin N synthase-like dioxygenase